MMSAKIINYIKSKNCYIFLLFIILFISSRVYFINYENNDNFNLNINFDNFFDKLYHHQSTNIGHFFLTYFYKGILGNSYTINNAIIINSVYSLTSIYFLSKIMRKVSMLSFITLSFYSILLIPYEIWRPFHWDHINLVIISFLIYSIFKFINNYKYYYLLLISSTLLILFNSIGFIIFIFVILYIFLLKNITKNIKILFLFPLFLILFIMSKNFILSQNFSPTSMGGANLIQRSIHAIGLENYYEMINLNKNKYPKWWLKIHNDIKRKEIKDIDKHTSYHAHGLSDGPKKRLDSFKYLKLILNSEYKQNNKLKKIIELEEKMIDRKFNSGLGYNIHNIGYYYMSQGKKVFFQSCVNFPMEMFIGKIGSKGFLLTGLQMVSYSSLFPSYYENQYMQWNKWFKIFNTTVKFLLYIILIFSIFIFIKIFKNKIFNQDIQLYFIVSLLTFLFVLVTSILTCCENPRLMIMYSPMIIYISYFNIVFIMSIFRK